MIHIKLVHSGIKPSSQSLRKQLKQAIWMTLDSNGMPATSELTVQLCSDDMIQQLNAEYLGANAPTDVLAFPAGELNPETGKPYLGDIIISFPYASRQAEEGGYAVEEELSLLVVHGTLHLLGFDHADEQSKSAMWSMQKRILDKLGCKIDDV
jgi:probable rRNA maturation factor